MSERQNNKAYFEVVLLFYFNIEYWSPQLTISRCVSHFVKFIGFYDIGKILWGISSNVLLRFFLHLVYTSHFIWNESHFDIITFFVSCLVIVLSLQAIISQWPARLTTIFPLQFDISISVMSFPFRTVHRYSISEWTLNKYPRTYDHTGYVTKP